MIRWFKWLLNKSIEKNESTLRTNLGKTDAAWECNVYGYGGAGSWKQE
ncbi:MAG: hypothetical protein LBD29_07495 [Treponema sp.]|nr:hypothetical protein [Treponema sp.]